MQNLHLKITGRYNHRFRPFYMSLMRDTCREWVNIDRLFNNKLFFSTFSCKKRRKKERSGHQHVHSQDCDSGLRGLDGVPLKISYFYLIMNDICPFPQPRLLLNACFTIFQLFSRKRILCHPPVISSQNGYGDSTIQRR